MDNGLFVVVIVVVDMLMVCGVRIFELLRKLFELFEFIVVFTLLLLFWSCVNSGACDSVSDVDLIVDGLGSNVEVECVCD